MAHPSDINPVLAQAVELCGTNQVEKCRVLLRTVQTTKGWPAGLAQDIEAIIAISDVPKETWLLLDPEAEGDKNPVPASHQATLDVEAALQKARANGRRSPFVESLLDDMERRLNASRQSISSARSWVLFSLLMSGSVLMCAGFDERQSALIALVGGGLLLLMVIYAVFARLPRHRLYLRFVKGEVFGVRGLIGSVADPRVAGDFLMKALPGVAVAPLIAIYDLLTLRGESTRTPPS